MRFCLADHGLVFSTRDRGAQLRVELIAATDEHPEEEIAIDFERVLSATNSFLDEFVGVLAEQRRVVVHNASPRIARTIAASLRRRGLDPRESLAQAPVPA
jgi:rhodanese-related sulfurtransferase